MILTFSEPQKFTDHFVVPEDTTSWDGKRNSTNNLFYYEKVSKNCIPARDQASFGSINDALKQKSNSKLPKSGLFLLVFEVPYKAIFIGIAVNEDISFRFRKYRTNITGSNVGSGVHSSDNWKKFTRKRFEDFQIINKPDTCSDVRFVIGKIDTELQETDHLEHFRYHLRHNSNGILDEICSRLWTGSNSKNVTILNNDRVQHDFSAQVILWAKEI